MKNVEIKQESGKLTITINTTKTFGASKTGKSIIVASTEGNQPLDGGLVLGLNCYKKA